MLKILVSICMALVGWVIQRAIVYLNNKLKESKFKQKLNKAITIVKNVVENLYQTIVQKDKEAGVFTLKKQKFVLQQAVEQSKNYMHKSVKKFICKEFKDINQWLQTQVEATIYSLKRQAA